jgi:hypothetical protein
MAEIFMSAVFMDVMAEFNFAIPFTHERPTVECAASSSTISSSRRTLQSIPSNPRRISQANFSFMFLHSGGAPSLDFLESSPSEQTTGFHMQRGWRERQSQTRLT